MRSILLTTMAGWLSRVLSIAVNVIGMPVVLHALGTNRFGIMLIALSIGSWIGLGNAGFGRAVGIITARYYQKSPAFVARVVSHLVIVSARYHAILFVACSAVFLVFFPTIDLGSEGAGYSTEFAVSTIAVFFTMALWFFLAVFEGVDAGRHQLFRLYWFHIIAYTTTLALTLTVFRKLPSLLFATLLLNSGFVIGNLMHAIDVWRRHRTLFTTPGRAQPALARSLLYNSVDFTIISMAISIIFQFTTGIVGLIVGPGAVINLGVFMRVMASVGGIILTVTYPMSNLIAGRLAEQDRLGAVKVALWTGAGLLLSVGLAAIAFDVFGERIVSLWLKTPIDYDPAFRMLASCLIFLTAIYAYASGVAIGFGNLRHVARVHAVLGAAVLPLAFVCFRYQGQAGILLAIDIVLFGGAAACLATGPRFINLRHLNRA